MSIEYHLGVQDVALLVQERAGEDPQAPQAPQYDEFDAASDDMDAVGADDVAAILAQDDNQAPGETLPLPAAPIHAGNRVHITIIPSCILCDIPSPYCFVTACCHLYRCTQPCCCQGGVTLPQLS